MSQSLDRGLRILDEIAAGRTTLTEMSESLGVHKTTVLRLLGTLQQHHFVHRVDPYHYQLGRRLFDLASFALESREIVAVAAARMRRLMQETGQTVYLATLENDQAVVVGVSAGRGPLHKALRVGETIPLHATATGKVLLAGMSEQDLADALDVTPVEAFTAHTLADREGVEKELAVVRSTGFAFEQAEHEEYVNAVAAPVKDSSGATIAALGLMVPVTREGLPLNHYTAQLLAARDDISAELGWV